MFFPFFSAVKRTTFGAFAVGDNLLSSSFTDVYVLFFWSQDIN